MTSWLFEIEIYSWMTRQKSFVLALAQMAKFLLITLAMSWNLVFYDVNILLLKAEDQF